MSKNLQKALIHVINDKSGKIEKIPVLFYPSEYTQTQTARYPAGNTMKKSDAQFGGIDLETLQMSLFFDTYESGEDVRIHTRKITNLMKYDSSTKSTPILKFIWGPINFTCVLESVTKKFTMFHNNGVPARATLEVTFKEKILDDTPREADSIQDTTKVTSIKAGDSLWAIAATAYGSPTMWRAIAKSNDIANPRLLEPGKEIAIPKYSRHRTDRCP